MKNYMHIGIHDLIRGYEEQEDVYHCAFCPAGFEKGLIYSNGDRYMEAEKAVQAHLEEKHGSVFDVLLQEDKKETGLSDSQKEILRHMSAGKSDKDISREIGITPSTVRNHRFKLREKEKQAKLFLALMANLNEPKEGPDQLIPVHKGAKMVDERYAITEKEREKAVDTYFIGGAEGPLRQFPSKEKRKIMILQTLLMRFDPDRVYTEREVNEILREAHDDFVTIRRYMIEYGLMTRSRDGSAYRLSGE